MNVTLAIVLLLAGSILIREMKKRIRMRKELKQRLQIGKTGEEETIRQLEKLWGHKRILKNLYVPLEEKKNTTEIDAVVIHEKGIIVVENKNYSGKIYGDEEEYHWIQVQKDGRKKYKKPFYNPVKQNRTHIRRLRRFVEVRSVVKQLAVSQPEGRKLPYVSVITFNGGAKLKRIFIASDEVLVSESRKVKRRLQRKLRRMPRVLTRQQVDGLYEELKVLEEPGWRVKRQHERYLNHGGQRMRGKL